MYVEGINKLVRMANHEQALIETALRVYAEQCEKDAATFEKIQGQFPAETVAVEPDDECWFEGCHRPMEWNLGDEGYCDDHAGDHIRQVGEQIIKRVKFNFITADGARMMAEQFRRYKEQTNALLNKIQGDDEENEPGYALALVQEEDF